MKIGIKKYQGILEGGIAVLCTISHEEKIYESLYWYDDKGHEVLSVVKELEELIGCKIEEHTEYKNLLTDIKSKVSNYDDVINELEVIR